MRLICTVPPFWIASGTLAANSPVVTSLVSGTTAIPFTPFVGQAVAQSAAIPAGTTISAVNSPSQITLSTNATASGSFSLYMGQEPITLAEAKLHARIEYDDEDDLVYGLIGSARKYCETFLRSALITQTWTLYLDSFPSAGGYYNRAVREIWPSLGGLPSGLGFYPGLVPNSTGVIDIPLEPLQQVLSVTYFDFQGNLQTYPSQNYNVSLGTPARIQPNFSLVWPISRPTIDSVQVSFVCGYGNSLLIPPNVKAAMELMVAHWFENREWVNAGSSALTVPNTVDALLSASDPGIYA